MKRHLSGVLATIVAIGFGLVSGWPAAAASEIVLGLQCDRTGPTETVGVNLCPGYTDYVALINSKGGVMGHRLKVVEVDNEYKVPPALEGYAREKRDGAVIIALYGTPQTYALTEKLTEDRIPGTSPGFGRADAADGTRYPYIFPIAATYWSQATAAVKFAHDQLGTLKDKKIAYLYYDNPAGHEPLPVLEALQKRGGFQLRTFAVPPPGIEVSAQILDIAQRYRADFVLAHLFGRSPSVSIKELRRVGYPLNHVLSFVWGAAEADVQAAGGFGVAEGYHGLEFAGVGGSYPVLDEIRAMYKREGKGLPAAMASTVYYNRGVLTAAIHVEAIRHALEAKHGDMITGADVKNGLEHIKGLTLGGLVPPIEITPTDHEGGGWLQVWHVKGGKFVKETDWFKAYPEVIAKQLRASMK